MWVSPGCLGVCGDPLVPCGSPRVFGDLWRPGGSMWVSQGVWDRVKSRWFHVGLPGRLGPCGDPVDPCGSPRASGTLWRPSGGSPRASGAIMGRDAGKEGEDIFKTRVRIPRSGREGGAGLASQRQVGVGGVTAAGGRGTGAEGVPRGRGKVRSGWGLKGGGRV